MAPRATRAPRVDVRKVGLAVAAPTLAILFSLLVTGLVLVSTGDPVVSTLQQVWDYGKQPRVVSLAINQGIVYYFSALAVAIGFRMNLFNIGVDGQYRLAAFSAAVVGGWLSLPKPLHITVIVLVAMAVGAVWAGIAALLKVTRGVSEVISTIMLNAIAVTLVGYLVDRHGVHEGNSVHTKKITEGNMVTGFTPYEARDGQIWALSIIAVIVGIGFWVLLNKTRFGFDLRASGQSETAARASGVNPKRMIVISMLLSEIVLVCTELPSCTPWRSTR